MGYKERIIELATLLNKYDDAYYNKDEQLISDESYDSLRREFERLSQEHPDVVAPREIDGVGYVPMDANKVIFIKRMLSLGNCFTEEDMRGFLDETNQEEYTLEFKYDGMAIHLTYDEGGELVLGATRGNGKIGTDITDRLSKVESIPPKVDVGAISIRGELVITKDNLKLLNELRKERNEEPYPSCRAALGAVRGTDIKLLEAAVPQFIPYSVIGSERLTDSSSHDEILKSLLQHGMPTYPIVVAKSIQDIKKFYDFAIDSRDSLDIDIDGIVIKARNINSHAILGEGRRAPNWATAWKFPTLSNTSRLEGIDVQVGRLGALTPMARIAPVQVAGTIIRNATLHNEERMNELEIRIGDEIEVGLAGDIVPAVLAVVKHKYGVKYEFPTQCPDCDSVIVKDVSTYRCSGGYKCPTQKRLRLNHFISKPGMNFKHIDESLVGKMIDAKMLNRPEDFYTIRPEDLLQLDGVENGTVKKFHEARISSYNGEFSNIIYALGINEVGVGTAELLAQNYRDIDALRAAQVNDLKLIKGIGNITAQHVYDFVNSDTGRETLYQLSRLVSCKNSLYSDVPVGSMGTVVITGSFKNYTREGLTKQLKANGYNVSGSVSKKTKYLIAGTDAKSKYAKALKLGVPIIEQDAIHDTFMVFGDK